MSALRRGFVQPTLPTLICAVLAGCGPAGTTSPSTEGSLLSGAVRVDGSSTVFPVAQAAAEAFGEDQPDVRVSVSRSGTSAGMGKFLMREVDLCDASRQMNDDERQRAQAAGLEIVEFTIAIDGLAVVANPANDWCDSMTVDQLRAIWRPEAEGELTNWNQIDARWADVPLKLFGPGTASGTFEYFTEEICGEKKASRSDYQRSEDDNMLVRGVAGEKGGLGYFGYAYYAENKDQLKLLAIDSGAGPVLPSEAAVRDGQYVPLSRPLYLYASRQALARPEVAAFVAFFLRNAGSLAEQCQYVAVTDAVRDRNLALLTESAP